MAKEAGELAAQGQRIADLRAAKARRDGCRVTQPMVADAVGVGLRAYQLWEAGDGDIDPANLKRLADYLDTTPNYIEYGADDGRPDVGAPSGAVNGDPKAQLDRIEARLETIEALVRRTLVAPAPMPGTVEEIRQALREMSARLEPASESHRPGARARAGRRRADPPAGA